MNARWMNTYVATAAQMLDVTDEMILEFSKGVIFSITLFKEFLFVFVINLSFPAMIFALLQSLFDKAL